MTYYGPRTREPKPTDEPWAHCDGCDAPIDEDDDWSGWAHPTEDEGGLTTVHCAKCSEVRRW